MNQGIECTDVKWVKGVKRSKNKWRKVDGVVRHFKASLIVVNNH